MFAPPYQLVRGIWKTLFLLFVGNDGGGSRAANGPETRDERRFNRTEVVVSIVVTPSDSNHTTRLQQISETPTTT